MAAQAFNRILILVIVVGLAMVAGHVVTGEKDMPTAMPARKHTNRLINETSPYLLQHAYNPVDWYPWSNEAFEVARRRDKPIFLSIGYSSCHWCHVMERESFSDTHIAKMMNEHFVNIKVDREERPDVDGIYMDAVQVMTAAGGWPLSVFLTPDGRPFFGGTYFPPEDRFGRPGFERVLFAIADAWENRRAELLESAGTVRAALDRLDEPAREETLSADILKNAYSQLERIFDKTYGGFGGPPKFPQPTNLSMLLGYWHRTGDERALAMVEATLDAMAKGGIYDHLGGGFHRYSTDARWFVPHFEKMLCDQALLSRSYVQAYQATGKETYARIARETFDYVLRDMRDPKGGFYSAEDADSEGKEGLFYVWELNEIKKVLGADSGGIFADYYGVTERGNFEGGKSILSVSRSIEDLAGQFNKDTKVIESILVKGRDSLLEHRARRARPHRDDKIICGWNGLMISSLAYGGATLAENKYVRAADRCAEFILSKLSSDGRLMRYYRNGKAVGLGVLDDCAFLIMGLVDLYEATFDVRWLVEAKKLSQQMVELFGVEDRGGFYLTGKDAERLVVRIRPDRDGAVPCGNSVAALVFLKLGRLTTDSRLSRHGEQVLEAFSGRLKRLPTWLTACLAALDFRIGPAQEIVIAGDEGRTDTKQMIKLVRSKFLPNAILLLHKQGKAGSAIEQVAPFVKNQTMIGGKATAYVCENYVCNQPVTEIDELDEVLSKISKPR